MNYETFDDWQSEWQAMPEFVQKKQKPYAQLVVRFDSQEDLDDFSQRIGQYLNKETKSIWHPKLAVGEHLNKRYVDES